MNRNLHFSLAILLAMLVIGCGEQSPRQGAVVEQRQSDEGLPQSNQEVANELAEMLRESGARGTGIEILYQRGRAELAGEMASAEDKQTVLEAVQRHPSVHTVEDRLTIK